MEICSAALGEPCALKGFARTWASEAPEMLQLSSLVNPKAALLTVKFSI